MAPPLRPLPDDVIPDILLRVPPDDPASLVRASAVCKVWRRALADPSFAARYRALHPVAPPVLGFLHRPDGLQLARFEPTPTSSFRAAAADRPMYHPLDCRHGRAVLYDYGDSSKGYVVWEPATGLQHDAPGHSVSDVFMNPAVLCAGAEGCDHRGCAGGPFIVAFADIENPEKYCLVAHAAFFSSDTGEWSVHINVSLDYDDHGRRYGLVGDRQAALVGEALYFVSTNGSLLRYRYGLLRRLGPCGCIIEAGIREGDVLSLIEPPPPGGKRLGDVFAMAAEGGGLGLASLYRDRLSLWVRQTGYAGDDAAGWVRRRVIDLGTLLPVTKNPKWRTCLSGFSQEANVIFVSTEDGVFAAELGALSPATKVCDVGRIRKVFPFESFYSEALLLKLAASGKSAAPAGNQ